MADGKKYKVVEIEADDQKQVYTDGGIDAAYTLDGWDNVLILHVGPNFNINANAGMIRRTFGYGNHRPVIFTRSPIRFLRVEEVVTTVVKLGWWARKWAALKALWRA